MIQDMKVGQIGTMTGERVVGRGAGVVSSWRNASCRGQEERSWRVGQAGPRHAVWSGGCTCV